MNVLMVGVDEKKAGGMWSVAKTYIDDQRYNCEVHLTYIATATEGSLKTRIFKMAVGYIKVIAALILDSIDIVHIHMAERGSVYRKGGVALLARLFRKKVVIQMHAGPIMAWYSQLPWLQKVLVRNIFNRCDKMLVLGEYWKMQLQEIVAPEKLTVLYNGANCPEYNQYNPDGKYILFLGMLTREKGVFDLINAVALVRHELPENLKILLCGYDKDGKVKEYLSREGLKEKVLLAGWIDASTREKIFSSTRFFVLPSYFEGLSMAVIEAMCYGIPVITTNISTMPELVGNDIPLVQPGDIKALAQQIKLLSADTGLCKKESEMLFKRARTLFCSEINISNTLAIYKACLCSES